MYSFYKTTVFNFSNFRIQFPHSHFRSYWSKDVADKYDVISKALKDVKDTVKQEVKEFKQDVKDASIKSLNKISNGAKTMGNEIKTHWDIVVKRDRTPNMERGASFRRGWFFFHALILTLSLATYEQN